MQSSCREVITSLFYPIVNAKAADAEQRSSSQRPTGHINRHCRRKNRAACDAVLSRLPGGRASAEVDDDPAYQQPRRRTNLPANRSMRRESSPELSKRRG